MSSRTAILVALASLLLLTWLAVALRYEAIQADLAQRVTQTLAAHAVTDVAVEVKGRDIVLNGEIAHEVEPAYVGELAAEVWGVRAVDVGGLQQRGAPLEEDERLNPRFVTREIVRLGGELSDPLDAPTCQRRMARVASASSVRFETRGATPMIESYPVLNDLAAVAYQCPETRLIIGGHTDAGEDRAFRLRLSQARARAVERFFYLAGIPEERMQVVAYGDGQPVASNASPEGRAANRRITFEFEPLH